ncbi:MAG: TolC family protein [Bacteroidota bacterium]
MRTIKPLTLFLLILTVTASAQTFSLKQCLDYAKGNNSNIKISYLNYEISEKQISEQIGTSMPQINFTGTLDDKLKITTQMLPGEMLGKPGTVIPVKMGTKYNSTAGFSLTQKIFDPSFWVALKGARLARSLTDMNIKKTDEDVTYEVSTAYYRALIINRQLANIQSILAASEKLLKATELRYSNGMAKKLDVDRIRVSFNNTKSLLDQTELNYRQALNNLKLKIGMPVENTLTPVDSLNENFSVFSEKSQSGDIESFKNRIDYQLKLTNVEVQKTYRQNYMAAYLPTLSFNASYNFQAMRQEFNIFDFSKQWFSSATIGLELKIPIFSGFSKLSRVQQAKLNVDIANETLKLAEQSIKVEQSNYSIQYTTAMDNIRSQKETLDLAESVYSNTQMEFQQGAASANDLVQAESSLKESQNQYYNKLLSLYTARLDLEKSQGTITNFINNLK